MAYSTDFKQGALYQIKEGHRHGESFAESVIREIYEETGLTIQNPQLVGIKNWPLDTGRRYIVFCYKATEFTGTLLSSEEGGAKRPDSKLGSGL